MEPPPGGPPDTAPPTILAVRPDSGAVVPGFDDEAEIRFSEVIEEQAAAAGGRGARAGLEALVVVSPVAGEVRVQWRRNRLTVKPREGWRDGMVYRLEVLPGIRDLRNNTLDSGRVILFSTGPAIPATRLEGAVVDWARTALLRGAFVEARSAGDSIGYRTYADSVGGFRLGGVPPGTYLVFAIDDQNRNRKLDRREASDSTSVTLDTVATVELWAFPRDTAPPRLRTAEVADSVAARVQVSQPLDPYQPLDTSMLRVRRLPDSTAVGVIGLWRTAVYDSLVRARAAARDTARGDTARAPTPVRPPPRGGQPPPDTSAARRILSRRPPLSDRLIIEVAEPWGPGQRYVIELRGLRSAAGIVAELTTAVLAVPEAKPTPRDTTPPDTTGIRRALRR